MGNRVPEFGLWGLIRGFGGSASEVRLVCEDPGCSRNCQVSAEIEMEFCG